MALNLQSYKIENGIAEIPLEDLKRLLVFIEQQEKRIASSELPQKESAFPEDIQEKLDNGLNPVKIIRKFRGYSQKHVSEETGISCSMLSEIENGVKTGSIDTLKKLSACLEVSLDELARSEN